MGHSTKGKSGKMEKPINKLYILPIKVQGKTPHLIEREIKD
jgi:hypothetical protein